MDCDGYPRIPMPLMCTAFVPGQIDAAVAGISDPDSRTIATAEALYFRGQATLAAETARPYLDATDPALRYSACFICGYASLSLNRIADARRCLAGILDTPTDEESPAVHATHILFASAASVLLHLPSPYSAEEFYPLAAHLPEGLRLFASYVMAHALYLRGEYGRSLGMAENALIMKQGSYPISELFLHLSASMACMSLKDIDAAKAHFGAAWDIARPDGLIELIGEHHGLLQGLIEACLKTQYPDDFARIIEITYRFSYGWRRIHNPDSGEDVADDLTTTEFTMAMLACRGWTNAEIARHMEVSPGTVKNRLSGVYAKLGIGTRAELPGGYVVNASSEHGETCVNGMSYSGRDGENSNSAIVVNVTPEDYGSDHPLAGMKFQRRWEKAAYEAGQGAVPVQLFGDYRRDIPTEKLGGVKPQIKGKYRLTSLKCCLPEYIKDAIIEGVVSFDKRMPGYSSDDAVLSGIEARTSSPVRMIRGDELRCEGTCIYPCGEGAGYAGGITSAAVDGMKVAEAIASRFSNEAITDGTQENING